MLIIFFWIKSPLELPKFLTVSSPVNCLWRKLLLQSSFRISVERLKAFVSIYQSVVNLFTLLFAF